MEFHEKLQELRRQKGLTQEELMDRLTSAHVKLNDGLFFGEMGRGFVRLNIACPRTLLAEELDRLRKVLELRK